MHKHLKSQFSVSLLLPMTYGVTQTSNFSKGYIESTWVVLEKTMKISPRGKNNPNAHITSLENGMFPWWYMSVVNG